MTSHSQNPWSHQCSTAYLHLDQSCHWLATCVCASYRSQYCAIVSCSKPPPQWGVAQYPIAHLDSHPKTQDRNHSLQAGQAWLKHATQGGNSFYTCQDYRVQGSLLCRESHLLSWCRWVTLMVTYLVHHIYCSFSSASYSPYSVTWMAVRQSSCPQCRGSDLEAKWS